MNLSRIIRSVCALVGISTLCLGALAPPASPTVPASRAVFECCRCKGGLGHGGGVITYSCPCQYIDGGFGCQIYGPPLNTCSTSGTCTNPDPP